VTLDFFLEFRVHPIQISKNSFKVKIF